MRCWPRQKVLLLPLQPLMSLAVPLQLSTLRAAVDAAAALPPPLLARALLLTPPLLLLLWLRRLQTSFCDDCGSDGSRAASGGAPGSSGCLGQRLHSLEACLPDVRVDGVAACAWAIAKETDAGTALGVSRRGARLASATSLSYRRAPRGQVMSRLRAAACAGMEQVWRQRLTACQIWR